jgi:hypothetical protein
MISGPRQGGYACAKAGGGGKGDGGKHWPNEIGSSRPLGTHHTPRLDVVVVGPPGNEEPGRPKLQAVFRAVQSVPPLRASSVNGMVGIRSMKSWRKRGCVRLGMPCGAAPRGGQKGKR